MARCMDAEVWGNLSTEILERVVAFLPLADLSRFRVVNKTFNLWILSSKFKELCRELPLRTSRLFMWKVYGLGIVSTFQVRAGAKFLDFDHEDLRPYSQPPWVQNLRAAAGGVLFLEYRKTSFVQTERGIDIVYDLGTHTCVRLPPPESAYHTRTVIHVSPKASGGFRVVYVAPHFETGGEHTTIDVYDSVVDGWRQIHIPLRKYAASVNSFRSVILFDKIIYLFQKFHTIKDLLVSFDMITGAEERILSQIPNGLLTPVPIATHSRLLLVGRKGEDLQIWEVDLPSKRCMKIAQKTVWARSNNFRYYAAGCDDFIFFSIGSQSRPTIYDLLHKTWRTLQCHPAPKFQASKYTFFIDSKPQP